MCLISTLFVSVEHSKTGFAKGGKVFGTLSTNINSSLVGIVAK